MKKLLLTIVTASTMLFSTNKSFADSTCGDLDQNQNTGTGQLGLGFYSLGQSFTPNITGSMCSIRINVTQVVAVGDVTLQIHSGNGLGGTLLVAPFLVSLDLGTNTINIPGGLNVISGQPYTFQLVSAGGEYVLSSSDINPYSSGTFYENGVSYGDYDLNFTTYVIPPQVSPTTQLSTSCGATGLTLSNIIFATPVAGATKYKFNFSNASLNYAKSFIRHATFSNITLSLATGLQYGQSYDVTVQAYVNGVWTAPGASCSITLDAPAPTTQLSTSCGATNLNLNSTIYANSVAGATKYEFKFVNLSLGYSRTVVRNAAFANTNLNIVSGLLMGQTYNVTVRAYVGNVWTTPGSSCSISLGLMGRPANTEKLAVVEQNNNEVNTQEVEEVIFEEMITEEVKTAPAIKETSTINNTTSVLEFTAYPNPVSKNSSLNISFNTEEIGKVILTDVTGRVVAEQNFNTNLQRTVEVNLAEHKLDNGIYNLSIIGSKTTAQKTIIVAE